jgi:hypothetical protein
MQIERDPSVYDFHKRMEAEHEFTGPQQGHRHFFRGDMTTIQLFKAYDEQGGQPRRMNSLQPKPIKPPPMRRR